MAAERQSRHANPFGIDGIREHGILSGAQCRDPVQDRNHIIRPFGCVVVSLRRRTVGKAVVWSEASDDKAMAGRLNEEGA
jgi:hypothetical protein